MAVVAWAQTAPPTEPVQNLADSIKAAGEAYVSQLDGGQLVRVGPKLNPCASLALADALRAASGTWIAVFRKTEMLAEIYLHQQSVLLYDKRSQSDAEAELEKATTDVALAKNKAAADAAQTDMHIAETRLTRAKSNLQHDQLLADDFGKYLDAQVAKLRAARAAFVEAQAADQAAKCPPRSALLILPGPANSNGPGPFSGQGLSPGQTTLPILPGPNTSNGGGASGQGLSPGQTSPPLPVGGQSNSTLTPGQSLPLPIIGGSGGVLGGGVLGQSVLGTTVAPTPQKAEPNTKAGTGTSGDSKDGG